MRRKPKQGQIWSLQFPADIRSMIQDSQENYAPAMKVFEEESAQAASREAAEIKQSQSSAASSAGSDRKTNGGVDGNRNDNHEYFLEEPTEEESEIEESSTEPAKSEDKKNSEFEYVLYSDHVVLKKYIGSAVSLDIPDTIEGLSQKYEIQRLQAPKHLPEYRCQIL